MSQLLKLVSLASLLLLVSGCRRIEQPPEAKSFGVGEAPLWSMPLGCEEGIRLTDDRVSVIARDVGYYHLWNLDMSDGHVLDYSDTHVERERTPADTRAEVSGNTLKPLRSALVKAIVPAGFDPVVVTDKFVFAKRSWWGLAYRSYIHHGQVDVVDRANGNIVWQLKGSDVSVQATPSHIVVCASGQTAAFLPQSTRPQEVTDFYSAVQHGDGKQVVESFPAWTRKPLFDLHGYDPLTLAAKEGQLEVVRRLLELKLPPNIESADGYSPLLAALNSDHADIVALLLEAGADPNYNAHSWNYPLAEAAENSPPATIDLLLKRGAKLNAVDPWGGQTALHTAVMYQNYAAVQALLEAGADRNIKDFSSKTASEMLQDECISYLFAGGKISDKPVVCAPPKRTTATLPATGLIN